MKCIELADLGLENFIIPDDDHASVSTSKAAQKTTTRIGRMANTQLRRSNMYYDNVNEQSKRSFNIACTLSIMGGVIFGLTIAIILAANEKC
jgi:hypothetical protein